MRPKTHPKRTNVINTLFIIGVLNGKRRRIAEVNREGAERKFGLHMDREALYIQQTSGVVRKECAHFVLETLRNRGAISKACGHGL